MPETDALTGIGFLPTRKCSCGSVLASWSQRGDGQMLKAADRHWMCAAMLLGTGNAGRTHEWSLRGTQWFDEPAPAERRATFEPGTIVRPVRDDPAARMERRNSYRVKSTKWIDDGVEGVEIEGREQVGLYLATALEPVLRRTDLGQLSQPHPFTPYGNGQCVRCGGLQADGLHRDPAAPKAVTPMDVIDQVAARERLGDDRPEPPAGTLLAEVRSILRAQIRRFREAGPGEDLIGDADERIMQAVLDDARRQPVTDVEPRRTIPVGARAALRLYAHEEIRTVVYRFLPVADAKPLLDALAAL